MLTCVRLLLLLVSLNLCLAGREVRGWGLCIQGNLVRAKQSTVTTAAPSCMSTFCSYGTQQASFVLFSSSSKKSDAVSDDSWSEEDHNTNSVSQSSPKTRRAQRQPKGENESQTTMESESTKNGRRQTTRKKATRSKYLTLDHSKKKVVFTPQGPVTPYTWKVPKHDTDVNPVSGDTIFCDLLMNDVLIDKSVALYNLLKRWLVSSKGHFRPVPLHVVYPRRFAKTTQLGFIEALFSPTLELEGYTSQELKTKIASLHYGKPLLGLGLHPVVRLELPGILSVDELNRHIAAQLRKAGLELYELDPTLSPKEQLLNGVAILNENFKKNYGATTKTIVLIDEHDKPFRDRNRNKEDPLIVALIQLFSISKQNSDNGISLMILCGLTRIVGTGLSSMNNLVDVSRQTKFHGLCGISVREIIDCAKDELVPYTTTRYQNQTFEQVLETSFVPNGMGLGSVLPLSKESWTLTPRKAPCSVRWTFGK